MKHIKLFVVVILPVFIFFSCNQNSTSHNRAANASKVSDDSSLSNTSRPSEDVNNNALQQIDTTKMKQDLNNIISGAINGKPDTNLLKKSAADILSTDAAVLSDSGISKMYGNSNDPSVKAAKDALIKMRNSMGITPDKLDSMRKSAALLNVPPKNN
jgi:hypothetical protein